MRQLAKTKTNYTYIITQNNVETVEFRHRKAVRKDNKLTGEGRHHGPFIDSCQVGFSLKWLMYDNVVCNDDIKGFKGLVIAKENVAFSSPLAFINI